MNKPQTGQMHATLLVEGGTIIAYDGAGHRRLEDGVVAIEGDTIVHVGRSFEGRVERRIDARGKLVIPGQVSTHAHVGIHEGPRFLLDGGQRNFVRTSFLHFLPTRRSGGARFLSRQDSRASLRYGFATLVRHGVTTVLAFAPGGADHGEAMLAAAEEMGIRLYWAPIVSGGRYWLNDDGSVEREMDEAAGIRQLREAVAFVECHSGAMGGRLSGAVILDEYYVSTPALRQEAKAAARSLSVPFTMHFIEQHREFFETMMAEGRTPIRLLHDEGLFDAQTLLAHCIYHAGHSLVSYPMEDDIALLGQSGASIAHSPVAFARRGVRLESFDRFRRAGVNMSLGTDTYPLDMFSEMRMAALMGKLADNNFEAAEAGNVFAAANLGGARALGRDDLGRISAGAKADLVIVDIGNLTFGVNPDPVRALVHLGTPQMIECVVIGGDVVVESGRLAVADEDEILADARASTQRVWDNYPGYDVAGRSLFELFQPAVPEWRERVQ